MKSDNIFYVYTLLIYILQEGTSKRIDCTIRESAMCYELVARSPCSCMGLGPSSGPMSHDIVDSRM